jgi:hypothetical protein
MHNMMVERHIQNDKIELDDFYECACDLGTNDHNYGDSNESSIVNEGLGNVVHGMACKQKKEETVSCDTSSPNDALKNKNFQNRWSWSNLTQPKGH